MQPFEQIFSTTLPFLTFYSTERNVNAKGYFRVLQKIFGLISENVNGYEYEFINILCFYDGQ